MPKFTHRLFKNCLVKYFCLYGYFIDFGVQSGMAIVHLMMGVIAVIWIFSIFLALD